MIKASQVSTLINEIYDGVERSKVGPIVIKDDKGEEHNKTLACQTYFQILEHVFPKNFNIDQNVTGDFK